MSSSEDDFDELRLSAETQKALIEFYEEQNKKLTTICDTNTESTDVKFDEDWVSSKI